MLRTGKATVLVILAALFLAPAAVAGLSQVGPITPPPYSVSPPSNFPAYYLDANGVAIDLPRPPVGDGVNAPTMIYFAPTLSNPYSVYLGFDSEAFYYYARALFNTKYGKASAIFGLEAGFVNGLAVPGDEMVFARVRLKAPVRDAGTYTFYHPWGTETIVVTAADVASGKAISFTKDVGLVPRDFAAVLNGPIGPFLKADVMSPLADPALWIGDGATVSTVSGTPAGGDARGFNKVTLVGPAGIDLDGRKNNFVTTNQWTVSGHKLTTLPAFLHVDRATCYTDPTGLEWVDVFATSNPLATVTVSGATIVDAASRSTLTTYTLISDNTGKFYFHAPSNEGAHTNAPFPISLTTTLTGYSPTTVTYNVIDQVNVIRAEYSISGQSLTIDATSTDDITPILTGVGLKLYTHTAADPTLTAIPAGGYYTLTIGPATGNAITVPPPTVTVTSSMGGADTTPVIIVP